MTTVTTRSGGGGGARKHSMQEPFLLFGGVGTRMIKLEPISVDASSEASFESMAVSYAMHECELELPDALLSGGMGSVQCSAFDACFSFDAYLSIGKTIVDVPYEQRAEAVKRWESEVASSLASVESSIKQVRIYPL